MIWPACILVGFFMALGSLIYAVSHHSKLPGWPMAWTVAGYLLMIFGVAFTSSPSEAERCRDDGKVWIEGPNVAHVVGANQAFLLEKACVRVLP